jgi:hypothetical protein
MQHPELDLILSEEDELREGHNEMSAVIVTH